MKLHVDLSVLKRAAAQMTSPNFEAWDEGREAFNQGESELANPYSNKTIEQECWADGWADGQEDEYQRKS